MNRGIFFRRTLLTLLTVSIMLFSAVVGAKIQMYTATGEDYPSAVESQDIAKQRALDKAIKKATKQAGVYLKTYSRSINSELTDDEITAITSNAWQLVGEPKFTREIINHSDDTQIIVWKATVEVNVNDSEIQSWIKRDDKDKSNIITQTREAQKVSEENDRQIEDLREKYNRATSQTEKDSIRKQMNDSDRDFLANQKLEEGLELYYARDYDGAIKFYNEALKIKPKYVEAYVSRGRVYDFGFLQHDKAIQDFNKAIELNHNCYSAYNNRGFTYYILKQYDLAITDYNKAIDIDPNNPAAYYNLSTIYKAAFKQYELAIKYINKAIELKPTAGNYAHRADIYGSAKNYDSAIADFNKAIELEPKNDNIYRSRAQFYDIYLIDYKKAEQDYTKAIELNPKNDFNYYMRGNFYKINLKNYNAAIQDYTKAIELSSKNKWYYKTRGDCYQQLGDEAKAQADFKKAKELGYNG